MPPLALRTCKSAAVELNLVPSQPAHFRGAQPVAVCDQDHGGVAVTVAGPLAGGFLEALNLLFGQVFPGAELGIGALRGTVRFTMVEGVRLRADFATRFNPGLAWKGPETRYCPN